MQNSTLDELNLSADNVLSITQPDNSMEPAFHKGTKLLFDISQDEIDNDQAYVLEIESSLLVRMLYQLPGGRMRLRSYNESEYPEETL